MENKEKNKVDVPYKDDNVGIRATLNNMGISNDKIGYDDKSGMVTLNGRAFMKPSFLDDDAGVSYAPEKDIQKSLTEFYKDSSNPIVKVSDAYQAAAGKYGLGSEALSYTNDTVTIGGMPLDTLFVDDEGKAWAWQNDVNNLAGQYVSYTGVKSPNAMAKDYEDAYMSDVWYRINELISRDEFSYDPEADPVYLAYKEKYLTEGERASKNAIADYSALTGGYTNSAAVTAGAQANQYYASLLANAVPELAEIAYERYNSENQTDLNLIMSMIESYDTAYENARNANSDTIKNVAYAAESNAARDESEREKYWDDKMNALDIETQTQENYWDNILNSQKSVLNDLDAKEQEIYLEYYRQLIESDLAKTKADTAKVWQSLYK